MELKIGKESRIKMKQKKMCNAKCVKTRKTVREMQSSFFLHHSVKFGCCCFCSYMWWIYAVRCYGCKVMCEEQFANECQCTEYSACIWVIIDLLLICFKESFVFGLQASFLHQSLNHSLSSSPLSLSVCVCARFHSSKQNMCASFKFWSIHSTNSIDSFIHTKKLATPIALIRTSSIYQNEIYTHTAISWFWIYTNVQLNFVCIWSIWTFQLNLYVILCACQQCRIGLK